MSFIKRWFEKLKRFVDRPWFLWAVAFLAGADNFIYFVPIEVLMVAAVLARKSRWLWGALLVTTGSALGALALAVLVRMDRDWIAHGLFHSMDLHDVTHFFDEHGKIALGLMALGPLPQQPAIALAAITHMTLWMIFVSVWVGRVIKYVFFAACARFFPGFIMKLIRHK